MPKAMGSKFKGIEGMILNQVLRCLDITFVLVSLGVRFEEKSILKKQSA